MKTNETPPVKIYLKPLLMEDGESVVRRCTLQRQSDSQIEYARTDAFVDKAVEWITNNCYIPHSTLENFRNYMEGE